MQLLGSELRRMSVDTELLDRIGEAENAWRAASIADELHSNARTIKAEQDTWDTYAQLCDDAQICLQPRCFVQSPAQAWCPEHGAK